MANRNGGKKWNGYKFIDVAWRLRRRWAGLALRTSGLQVLIIIVVVYQVLLGPFLHLH